MIYLPELLHKWHSTIILWYKWWNGCGVKGRVKDVENGFKSLLILFVVFFFSNKKGDSFITFKTLAMAHIVTWLIPNTNIYNTKHSYRGNRHIKGWFRGKKREWIVRCAPLQKPPNSHSQLEKGKKQWTMLWTDIEWLLFSRVHRRQLKIAKKWYL